MNNTITIYQNKRIVHNWFNIRYGTRRSKKLQLFPVWNTSNNCQKSLMFGFLKFYFEIVYHRKTVFNQRRQFILLHRFRKFYQLFF